MVNWCAPICSLVRTKFLGGTHERDARASWAVLFKGQRLNALEVTPHRPLARKNLYEILKPNETERWCAFATRSLPLAKLENFEQLNGHTLHTCVSWGLLAYFKYSLF
jgi:hypothetical protein